jgi:hypothetical protein
LGAEPEAVDGTLGAALAARPVAALSASTPADDDAKVEPDKLLLKDLYFNFDYHSPMHGFGLPDDVLKKVYRDNLARAFKQARGDS